MTLYHYRAIAQSVYDGDTITVSLDLGLHTWIHGEKLRLARVDAPEVRGASKAAGIKARDYLISLVVGKPIVVQTIKDRREKYGRYLAEVWLEVEGMELVNVNDLMVEAGHAEYREY